MCARHVSRTCLVLPSGLTANLIENETSLWRTPCPIADTNSHDSHPPCDQYTFTCGSPVGTGVSATTRVANMRKRFTMSKLCFKTALLTHCKRHDVAPTNQIHEATLKNGSRGDAKQERTQRRRSSTGISCVGHNAIKSN